MNELPEDPTNRELLERIVAVESKNAELIARIVELETRATNTFNAFFRLSKQVGGVLENIGSMDMELMGLLTKVFPDYFRTRGQINKILASAEKPGQREKDQPG